MNCKQTSGRIAKDAAILMHHPDRLVRSVSASAVSQARGRLAGARQVRR